MKRIRDLPNSESLISIALIILLSAAAFLPFIGRFGYYSDDWYEMYAAGAQGPQVFHAIFAIDRPGRAYLMIPLYMLFGQNPLPYNLTAYLFRLLGGLSALWALRILWPGRRRAALLAALFFTIYPGFLTQPNAINLQPQIAALFFASFSIALSLQAVLSKKLWLRILLSAVSILFGLAYLGQLEYYAGFEVVRLVFFFILMGQGGRAWLPRLKGAVRWYLPFAAVPLGFSVWRLFFFQNTRGATDLARQLNDLSGNPVQIIAAWTVNLIQSAFNVVLLSWTVPLYNALASLPPSSLFAGLAVTIAAILVTWALLRRLPPDSDPESGWQKETLWAGLIIVVGGLIPVIIANRTVDLIYSRYSLISLIGAVMILTAFVEGLRSAGFRHGFALLLVGVAVLTHFANGLSFAHYTDSSNAIWWQLSWRIPQLQTGTTLMIHHPLDTGEVHATIWGPANLIYYPQSQDPRHLQPAISAGLLNQPTEIKILLRKGQEFTNLRSIRVYTNYRNVLLLSRPTPASCLQVIDGQQPEFSSSEDARVRLLAPYSKVEGIVPGTPFVTPPRYPFGPEPPHGWCYYYEKAAYARQTGDWQTIVTLGGQAAGLGLAPQDLIEWMPFVQAYAHFGDQTRLKELAGPVTSDPLVAEQACRMLLAMQLDGSTGELAKSLYCLPR
jgi:hypothetical protein